MRRTGFVRRRPLRTGIVALSALAVMVLSPAPPGALAAYAEQVLYRFCSQTNCVDGKNPVAAPIMDGGGNLYGTTVSGGANNGGVVFKLTPTATGWTYSVLYSFCSKALCADGGTPNAGLLMDGMGNLYGTTTGGGPNQSTSGVVFKLAPSGSGWTEMVLYSFCAQSNCADGAQPYAGLIMDAAGNLYGTTVGGGNSTSVCTGGPGCGVVFKLAPTSTGWAETVLYRFCSSYPCADGANPAAGLLMDGAGNLYGTTAGGGYGYDAVCGSNHGCGVVFELTPTVTGWKETVIYAFCPPPQSNCTDGANPYAGLTMDGAGNLYGTTANAGFTSGHLGNVFELMPTGTGGARSFFTSFARRAVAPTAPYPMPP